MGCSITTFYIWLGCVHKHLYSRSLGCPLVIMKLLLQTIFKNTAYTQGFHAGKASSLTQCPRTWDIKNTFMLLLTINSSMCELIRDEPFRPPTHLPTLCSPNHWNKKENDVNVRTFLCHIGENTYMHSFKHLVPYCSLQSEVTCY